MWGKNNGGQLGQNNRTNYSSPIQSSSLIGQLICRYCDNEIVG